MERTEIIPQTSADLGSGHLYYHFSLMTNSTNPPNPNFEHQIAFFEVKLPVLVLSRYTYISNAYRVISLKLNTAPLVAQRVLITASAGTCRRKHNGQHNSRLEIGIISRTTLISMRRPSHSGQAMARNH
jgi:hypothetical protein